MASRALVGRQTQAVMDLGELLRDALDENSDYGSASGVDILACFDFQTAAEAFLAKVRAAERAELEESNPAATLYDNVE